MNSFPKIKGNFCLCSSCYHFIFCPFKYFFVKSLAVVIQFLHWICIYMYMYYIWICMYICGNLSAVSSLQYQSHANHNLASTLQSKLPEFCKLSMLFSDFRLEWPEDLSWILDLDCESEWNHRYFMFKPVMRGLKPRDSLGSCKASGSRICLGLQI